MLAKVSSSQIKEPFMARKKPKTVVGKALDAVADFIRPAKKKAKRRPLKKLASKVLPRGQKRQDRRVKRRKKASIALKKTAKKM
jgi:hypothetical protein